MAGHDAGAPGRRTRRIAMGVEYDGGAYSGWQLQHHADTVQARLEVAVGRVAAAPVRVHCAGRTDAGVHATGQVVHFDTQASRSSRSWVLGANSNLPDDIAVRWAQEVAPDFHARFSATGRHYRYLILCRPTRSALWRGRAVWTHKTLHLARMRTAGSLLVGRHDFTSFRALACQAKSPVRTLRYLRLGRRGELLTLEVGADGFLHHMVRNIAGVLMAIGSGEASIQWAAELLAVRNRAFGGVTAPPHGLYLAGVDYPAHFQLPPLGDAAGPPVL
ncbi:tRNA pseudouridine(38-40) synthase TruA [Thiohalocapsa sp.]|uniref:tRNA pseudouridine(38-40) synthase TruA n=1 Tax=Thiohalocapsa sp. TaxID=2497641 RepID=UPI0025F047B0|nr:tRNA pseudouridine(38-40) synthase TruA [Thiohalocapsa sp.]